MSATELALLDGLIHLLVVTAVFQLADLVGRLNVWLRWRWSR